MNEIIRYLCYIETWQIQHHDSFSEVCSLRTFKNRQVIINSSHVIWPWTIKLILTISRTDSKTCRKNVANFYAHAVSSYYSSVIVIIIIWWCTKFTKYKFWNINTSIFMFYNRNTTIIFNSDFTFFFININFKSIQTHIILTTELITRVWNNFIYYFEHCRNISDSCHLHLLTISIIDEHIFLLFFCRTYVHTWSIEDVWYLIHFLILLLNSFTHIKFLFILILFYKSIILQMQKRLKLNV